MSHSRAVALVASIAAFALAIPSAAGAADSPPTVFNFGHCVSSGFPDQPSGFGPLIFITGGEPGFFAQVPPGQFNNAPSGSIGCAAS